MIHRQLFLKLQSLATHYPVVTITGPRQSGKTTLCRHCFPEYAYVNLEHIDTRERIKRDPNQFIQDYAKGVIIDEVQHYPELMSYIQVKVDETGKPGQFILTGSQNFNLLSTISQSLAGRTALLSLLPFSLEELSTDEDTDERMFRGFFPRVIDQQLNPTEAMQFYVSTYIERDIRQLLNVKNLSQFSTFLKLCAVHTGQLVNFTKLGDACGISYNTAKEWLSLLETSYIVTLLHPHYQNLKKRLVKSPKLYLNDTGLICYLLDIYSPDHLKTHPLRGAIFESMIVVDYLKQRFNRALPSNLYFFRDHKGFEIDIIQDEGLHQIPIEIKSGQTIHADAFKNLKQYMQINPHAKNPIFFYGGKSSYTEQGITVKSILDLTRGTTNQ